MELDNGKMIHLPGDKVNEAHIIIFFSLWCAFLIAENILYSGFDTGPALITSLMGFSAYKAVKISCYPNPLGEEMKKDFLLYVILTSTSVLVVYSPVMGIVNVLFIFLASLVWAVVSMKVLYGSWLYFP